VAKKEYQRDKALLPDARLNFLLNCSDDSLSTFELARLAEVANLRTELHVILDKLIDEMAQAALAGWFRQNNRETLKRAVLTTPEESTAEILAWAREKIRSQGKEGEPKVPRMSLAPGAAHLAASLRYKERNLAEGKCRLCPQPLARNSVLHCEKHLAATRARAQQKKALSLPGSREYLYSGEVTPTKGRDPNTLARLAMLREQKTRGILAELGIPPENAAVSLNAAKEALLKCMPATKDEAMTAGELFDKASIPTSTTGRSALKELLSVGRIERTGKGFPSNPFRYCLADTPEHRKQFTKSRIQHNQAIQAILKGDAE
jgi:hypothetical protein